MDEEDDHGVAIRKMCDTPLRTPQMIPAAGAVWEVDHGEFTEPRRTLTTEI